jgi:hypothetical protein
MYKYLALKREKRREELNCEVHEVHGDMNKKLGKNLNVRINFVFLANFVVNSFLLINSLIL